MPSVAAPTAAVNEPSRMALRPLTSLPSLDRMVSSGVAASDKVKANAMPRLMPVTLEPMQWSNATQPLAFLNRLERIEVNETRVRNGVTYYVMDIFLHHSESRLPTNQHVHHHAPRRSLVHVEETREPDLRMERRFSDFARLRDQVLSWACLNPSLECQYCMDFIIYIRYTLRQPRSVVKLFTGTETRKKILEQFMNDFADLAQGSLKNCHRCEAHEHVPSLLQSFLLD